MGSCFSKGKKEKLAVTPAVLVPSPAPAAADVPSVRLIADPLCPHTASLYTALQFKGVHVEAVWVDKETKASAYPDWVADLSPDGKTPVFQHGDQLLTSADEALEYLGIAFPTPPLVPAPPLEGEVREWAKFARGKFAPLMEAVLAESSPAVLRDVGPKIEAAFDELERALHEHRGAGPFFFGSNFSLVDVHLAPFLNLVPLLSHFQGIDYGPLHKTLSQYGRVLQSCRYYAPVRPNPQALRARIAMMLTQGQAPAIALVSVLQHQALRTHMQRLVQTADSLAVAKQWDEEGRPIAHPVRELWMSYGRLLEVLQEHAQMEERVLFPILEKAVPGLTREANGEHAKHLPVMNGIREDIKSAMALELGSSICREAFLALAIRLRNFQVATLEHFEEEERDLFGRLHAFCGSRKQQESMLSECLAVMEATHGRLFPFLLSALQPHEVEQYIMTVQKGLGGEYLAGILTRMLQVVRASDPDCWAALQQRMPSMTSMLTGGGG